jgi:hypothetical protein
LANWRKEGRIPYWKLSARALRYSLSDVERALSKPEKLEADLVENKQMLILHYGHEFKRLERDRLLGDDNPPR